MNKLKKLIIIIKIYKNNPSSQSNLKVKKTSVSHSKEENID